MNNAVLTLATQTTALPSGTTAGLFRFILTDGSGNLQQQDVPSTTASFTNVADGSCSASCSRLDSNGNPFGNVATLSFTAPTSTPPPTTFDEPATLTAVATPQ